MTFFDVEIFVFKSSLIWNDGESCSNLKYFAIKISVSLSRRRGHTEWKPVSDNPLFFSKTTGKPFESNARRKISKTLI